MIDFQLAIFLLFVLTLMSLVVTAVNYSLREYSRARLSVRLSTRRLEWLTANEPDLHLILAAARLLVSMGLLPALIELFRHTDYPAPISFALACVAGLVLLLIFCLAIPYALAANYAERIVSLAYRPLKLSRILFSPVLKFVHAIERGVSSAANTPESAKTQSASELQEEILSVVDEGRRDGLVDLRDQRMIESVIAFRTLTVEEAMTPHGRIVGIPEGASLEQVREAFEKSGHSRVPVYEDTVDHITGILYARDLLHIWGATEADFKISGMLRKHYSVPHTKLLRDLLQEFRDKKVHIAIVSDEFGGTAGLITIEDILERIVGEIADEHEPITASKFTRIDESTVEVDAQIEIDELNRLLGLNLPEDGEYSTLAGMINTEMGKIPQEGTRYDREDVSFIVTQALPYRLDRVRIELRAPAIAARPGKS